MGDIVSFNNNLDLAAFGDLDVGLGQVLADTHLPGFEKLLRMSRDGLVVYGADNVPLGDYRIAINPLSVQHGWIAWAPAGAKKNEILGEVMVPAKEPKPLRQDLPANVDATLWKDQLTFNVLILEGPGRGEQLLYKVNSTSGVRESLALVGQIRAQRREAASAGHTKFIPIARVGTSSFDSNYGRQHKPVWHIVDWVSPGTDLGALYAATAATAAKEKPIEASSDGGVAARSRRVPG